MVVQDREAVPMKTELPRSPETDPPHKDHHRAPGMGLLQGPR